ncbi:MAG TPA: M28 family peptidase [Gemmatimonadales bacterium]
MRRARRNSLFDRQQQELDAIHARYAPVDQRVHDILANIRRDCTELNARKRNAGNEAQVEAFVASLTGHFGGRTYEVTRDGRRAPVAPADAAVWKTARARTDAPCVVIERQRLSAWAVRTTRWNYLFTVPGDSAECVVLVAHYDTWRGPGADDNTTGEEILKQYLLADLGAPRRPALTHVYFFAGSEECGLVGLFSQVLLSLGMLAGNFALTYRDWGMLAIAIALLPVASYRFGVSGSREYVRTLSEDELRRIRAVVSIDSVGEGRLYIPRGTMGADFLRVLIPFGDYDSLNDLLEEAAHLHGIKYNNFLAGGTTDHVSFLEVHNGLWARLRAAVSRSDAPFLIPASALVAMRPGKASPIVFGGKIHTPNDTPDRVYAEPLRETLLVLDYFLYRIDGGTRVGAPRWLDDFHYARLFRVDAGHVLALKDAVEPNRRNVNGVYGATATIEGNRAHVRLGGLLGWGVETRLRDEVVQACGGRPRPVPLEELEVTGNGVRLRFARITTPWSRWRRLWHNTVLLAQGIVRRFLFITFFAAAYALAQLFGWGFDWAFETWPRFGLWVADHVGLTITVTIVVEMAILLQLMTRRVPAWIDNGYKHQNKADNLGSLKRVKA